MPGVRKKSKNVPVLSHEFITANHGDIVSCLCMVFMIGLMFKTTQKVAGVFIAPQYNVTKTSNAWIVVHAVVQEYILDKLNRKFHLSKTKISRFNNLGAHIPFFFASAAWGADIILKEELLPKVSNLWHGYPHTEMTFMVKFYFILQMAYWVHCFPELYFLKAKKEEWIPRVRVYLQYLSFIISAYVFNFTRLALVCLVIHYFVEFLFHVIKILNYMGKTEGTKNSLVLVWAILYTIARIAIIMLSVMTIWVGLPKQDSADKMDLIPNFNKKPLRITFLVATVGMQGWLAWLFILNQVSYWRDVLQTKRHKFPKKKEQKKKAKKDEQKKAPEEDDGESPLVNGKQKIS